MLIINCMGKNSVESLYKRGRLVMFLSAFPNDMHENECIW